MWKCSRGSSMSNKSGQFTGQMKLMKNSTVPRTYDADGLRRRAACLCFRDKTEQEVLLISSTHDIEKWIVPGGGIDPGEESVVAAEREALEEAGVTGAVDRLLGVFEKRGLKLDIGLDDPFLSVSTGDSFVSCATEVEWVNREKNTRTWVYAFYVLHLEDHWTESKSLHRRRQWFPLCDAKKVLSIHKPLQVSYINVVEAEITS